MSQPPPSREPDAGDASDGKRGSILDRRRWHVALQLGGMGDSVGTLLPLFAIGVLGADLGVAAGTAAAYTVGALSGNLLIWGRLADRLRSPRGLAILGLVAQGTLLVLLGLRPGFAPILVYAVVLGAFSVSMDAALLRLVAGDLEARERLRAMVRFAALTERGILLGLLVSTIALPLFGRFTDSQGALRAAIVLFGGLILLEAAIALSTVSRQRAAPRLAATLTDLGMSGAVVVWAGATTPVQRVLRVAPLPAVARVAVPEGGSKPRLPESLILMLASLMVLHAGFGMQGNLMALFLRAELGFQDGTVLGVFLFGSVLTNVSVSRVSDWLDSIPAVQVQVGAGAVRSAVFGGYLLLALIADLSWVAFLIVPLYAVSQLCWGAIIPANTRRFADLAPPSRRGEVAALQSASIGGGVALGAAAGGVIAETVGFPAMFAVSALLALSGTLLLLRW